MRIALFALLLGIASIHARLIDTCVDNTVLLGCRGQPQLTPSDFLIDFSDLDVCFGNQPCYTPGVTYSLALYSPANIPFKGFLVQSKLFSNPNILVGDYSDYGVYARPHMCDPITGGITHIETTDKRIVQWKWTAPLEGTGDIQFFHTVVRDPNVYWVDQPSPVIIEKTTLMSGNGIPSIVSTGVPLTGNVYPHTLDKIVQGVASGIIGNCPYLRSVMGVVDRTYGDSWTYANPAIPGVLDNQCPALTDVIKGVTGGMIKSCPYLRSVMGVDGSIVPRGINDIYSRRSILSPNMWWKHEELKHLQTGISPNPLVTRLPLWNTLEGITPNYLHYGNVPYLPYSPLYWNRFIGSNPLWYSKMLTNPITPYSYSYNPFYMGKYNPFYPKSSFYPRNSLFYYKHPIFGMPGIDDYMRMMKMDPRINFY